MISATLPDDSMRSWSYDTLGRRLRVLARVQGLGHVLERVEQVVPGGPRPSKAVRRFPDADPLFLGTASGMMADGLIVDRIKQSDLVIGIGYDPVESDKIWHKDQRISRPKV
mgnify:CR=1 FL=1